MRTIVFFKDGQCDVPTKLKMLRKKFKNDSLEIFEQSYDADLDLQKMSNILKTCENVIFVGESIGCIYAAVFGHIFEVHHVLIDPVFDVDEASGTNKEFYDKFKLLYPKNEDTYLRYCILAKKDSDTSAFLAKYSVSDSKIYMISGGGDDEQRFKEALQVISKIDFVIPIDLDIE